MDSAAGWYGKLPGLGDFASRRLPPEWVARWDDWLATGLQALRTAAPDTWLQHYLAAPAWRLALLPGAVADDGLRVGVLVPSVDRVGRYFPLVVVSQPLARPADLPAALALWQWAGQLEDIAVTALQEDWDAAALDQALLDLADRTVSAGLDAAPPTEPLARLLAERARSAVWRSLQGHSLWGQGTATPLLHNGLPQGPDFQRLFTPA